MPRKLQKFGTPLSLRELKLLQELSKGHTREQIVPILNVSVHTINEDMLRIYEKLGTKNLLAIVARLIREGVI